MKKKLLVATVAACLASVALVGGTLAYFQDSTQEVVNTFTVGNVHIDLVEPEWKGGDNLNPGEVVNKDPKIINTGRSDGYVLMKVTGMNRMVEQGFLATYDSVNWDRVDDQGKVDNTDKFALADGYYVFKGQFEGKEKGVLPSGATTAPLFKTVKFSEDVKEVTGGKYKIMGMLEDGKGLFSYEDANGVEIAENVDRQPTVFNEDGTPKVFYVINSIPGQVFDSVADAEAHVKDEVKEEVSFKFDLTLQGFAIQTSLKDNAGNDLGFDPYTNWVPELTDQSQEKTIE